MENILIVHNPTAGDAEHDKKHLLDLFKKSKMTATYVSSDEEGWEKKVGEQPDAIFLAGGDGTVRSLALELLKLEDPAKRPPVHLLPLGTANNVATTLGVKEKKAFKAINPKARKRKVDCGRVKGFPGEDFFVEGVGMGVFPELIAKMKEKKDEDPNETPEEKLQRTLKVLLKIIKKYKAQKAKIEVDGFTIRGSFLMVEVMNTRFVGPNLELGSMARISDGYLNLILIPEEKRGELKAYVKSLINDENSYDLKNLAYSMKVKKVEVKWKGDKVHVDDVLDAEYSGKKLKMKVLPGAIFFLR